MSHSMHKLAKETALYSISSILGKFLNWMMVPLYTYVLANSADYGIVTNLYSWTVLLLVVLTYGMETGLLRFVNSQYENPDKVFSTTLISITVSSTLFAILGMYFQHPLAKAMGYGNHPEYIAMLSCIVAMDAFCSIPLVYLRYKEKVVRFVGFNILGIVAKIAWNLFFLVLCPWIHTYNPALISWFYNPDYGVGYVFIANILSTSMLSIALLFEIIGTKFTFDRTLWKRMLHYSFPLMILGISGVMNQSFDKILFPFLLPGAEGQAELGVYGATSKIAMVILMLSQAFFNAYEPLIFAQHSKSERIKAYADSMQFYIGITLFIFLVMTMYIDIIKYLIRSDYWIGLEVVPVVMLSYLFQGIFFNLSLWYKLTDKTLYGAVFAAIGACILITGNVILIPLFGYWGAAWASVICYFSIMLLSYLIGQKVLPVNYNFKNIALYFVVSILLFSVSFFIKTPFFSVNIVLKTLLIAVFLVLLMKCGFPMENLPGIHRFFKTKSTPNSGN